MDRDVPEIFYSYYFVSVLWLKAFQNKVNISSLLCLCMCDDSVWQLYSITNWFWNQHRRGGGGGGGNVNITVIVSEIFI